MPAISLDQTAKRPVLFFVGIIIAACAAVIALVCIWALAHALPHIASEVIANRWITLVLLACAAIVIIAAALAAAAGVCALALSAAVKSMDRFGDALEDIRQAIEGMAAGAKQGTLDAVGLAMLAALMGLLAYIAPVDPKPHHITVLEIFVYSGIAISVLKMLLYLESTGLRRLVWILVLAAAAAPVAYAWISNPVSIRQGVAAFVGAWSSAFVDTSPDQTLLHSLVATLWILVAAFPLSKAGWKRFMS